MIVNMYQKIGDYFTGASRRRTFYIAIAVVTALLWYFSDRYKYEVSVDTLRVVFSSIFQGLIALVALLGVAAIFKLQILSSEEDDIVKSAFDINKDYYLGIENKGITTGQELLERLNKFNPATTESSKMQYVDSLKNKLEHVFLARRLTSEYIMEFTIYTFVVIIFSLICLTFSWAISKYYLGQPVFFIVFLMVCRSLFLVIKGTHDAIVNS